MPRRTQTALPANSAHETTPVVIGIISVVNMMRNSGAAMGQKSTSAVASIPVMWCATRSLRVESSPRREAKIISNRSPAK